MRPAAIVVAAMFLFSACGDDGPTPPPPPGPAAQFPAGFEASYREVRNCRFSNEHDGVYIMVFASPDSADAYANRQYPLPVGSILVKREHRDSSCTDITGYTSMKKVGTASVASDWTWQRVDKDRVVLTDENLGRCVSCHTNCTNGRDFTCTDP
jgi:hypothetical protein